MRFLYVERVLHRQRFGRSLCRAPILLVLLAGCAVSGAKEAEMSASSPIQPAGGGREAGPPEAMGPDAAMAGDANGASDENMSEPDAGSGSKPELPSDGGMPGDRSANEDANISVAPDAAPICAPVDCSDGVGCTLDGCKSNGQCEHTPDDARCNAGEHCVLGQGCVASCEVSPCKLVGPQCGCVSGQGCYPDQTGAPSCSTAGTMSEGQKCTKLTDCKPGNMCVDVSFDATKPAPVCKRMCGADSDCSGEGSLCVTQLADANGNDTGIRACSKSCDPVEQFGCPSGTGCGVLRESDGQKRFFTDCVAPVGTATDFVTCSSTKPCAAGYGCLNLGSGLRCYRYCSTDNDCSGLDLCLDTNPVITVGSTRYGVCQ